MSTRGARRSAAHPLSHLCSDGQSALHQAQAAHARPKRQRRTNDEDPSTVSSRSATLCPNVAQFGRGYARNDVHSRSDDPTHRTKQRTAIPVAEQTVKETFRLLGVRLPQHVRSPPMNLLINIGPVKVAIAVRTFLVVRDKGDKRSGVRLGLPPRAEFLKEPRLDSRFSVAHNPRPPGGSRPPTSQGRRKTR